MNLAEILVLAVALGIDCLVVSFSQGLIFKTNYIKNSLTLALSMGFFQGLMPCLTYFGTGLVIKYIEPYSKWLVFLIFMTLGVKFIFEVFYEKREKFCCLGWQCLLSMGLATSIDALVSGINLSLTQTSILVSVLIIGFVSFIMAFCGYLSGIFFKFLPSKVLEIFGGLILIFLAVKQFY